MRNPKYAVAVVLILFPMLPACAQQEQFPVVRHPGEHLHYTVQLADGDVGKVANVTVSLLTSANARPDQPNAISQFGTNCQRSSDPKIWNCDVEIPEGLRDGDYQLFQVGVSATNKLGTIYTEDFHVPMARIKNLDTFTPPSSVTVKQKP